MKLLFRTMKMSGLKYAVPACELSEMACKLVNQKYLTTDQIKLLFDMGFNIEAEFEELKPSNVNPLYTEKTQRKTL
jgi:hypothetical protein